MNRSWTVAVAVLATVVALSGCASSVTSSATSSGGAEAAGEAATSTSTGASIGGGRVTFNGVTVSGGSDLKAKPTVSAHSAAVPAALQVKDLVVGSGASATPSSTVTVQYVGSLLAYGKQFDSSWDRGQAATFSLQQVVPGFTQGIGGTTGVTGMKAGGRRIMILPADLGYGSSGTPDGSIPPNAPIVFVVDLLSVQ